VIEKKTHIVISYFPLLRERTMIESPTENQFKDLVESLPFHSAADGCLWVLEDGSPVPVLLFEDAKEIYDHMVEWSEKEPEKWFKLHLAEDQGWYGFGVFPNPEMSVARYKLTRLALYEQFVGADDEYTLFYQPLSFFSNGPEHTFGGVKKRFLRKKKTKVGFMQTSEFKSISDLHDMDAFEGKVLYLPEKLEIVKLSGKRSLEFFKSCGARD
jgi:hypothetical protein